MRTRDRIPLRLLDVAILVAATGPPLALARGMLATDGQWAILTLPLEWSFAAFDPMAVVPFRSQRVAALATPYLASWMLALLGIILLRPASRRGRRKALRRPGAAAALAMVAVVVIELASWAAVTLPWRLLPAVPKGAVIIRPLPDPSLLLHVGAWAVGAAIGSTWIGMALAGAWRPEPSWIDRLGRLLGGVWIALTPLHLLASSLAN